MLSSEDGVSDENQLFREGLERWKRNEEVEKEIPAAARNLVHLSNGKERSDSGMGADRRVLLHHPDG